MAHVLGDNVLVGHGSAAGTDLVLEKTMNKRLVPRAATGSHLVTGFVHARANELGHRRVGVAEKLPAFVRNAAQEVPEP